MVNPDPSLGIDVDFDDDGFRNAIKFAMQMGTNPDPDKRPIFLKKNSGRVFKKNGVVLTTEPRIDRDGNPFDPEIEVVVTPDDRLTDIDCAVEIERADAEELPVGNFRPTKAVITLLDIDYAKVSDCRELIYNGDRYMFGYEPDAPGLFEVGVHTMIFYARDES